MLRPEDLKKTLCSTFCGGVSVNPVASGYAISSTFEDSSGDPISFYLTPSGDGYVIEDDGSYLSHLVAKDIPIDQGQRGQLLDAILDSGNAYWDRDTFEIRTSEFSERNVSRQVIDFLSSMIRVRDLELLTREVVRSTFRDDVISALQATLGDAVELEENAPISRELKDFPADLVVTPRQDIKSAKRGALYLVNSPDKLNEALLLQLEAQRIARDDFEVIALVEQPGMSLIGGRKFQRAQNRGVLMPIFREDEEAAVNLIRHRLQIPLELAA